VIAIAVVAEICILALLLHNLIKDFLFIHPWVQAFIAAIPAIAVPILAWFELQHSNEANVLRTEANDHRNRANALQEEQGESLAQIARLQTEIVKLSGELDAERNKHLEQIAVNTRRPRSEAEVNAEKLKKHLGQRAFVTEGQNQWGSGVVVAEVNENIVTLFVPASFNNSQAYGQLVRCDKLHVVESPKDGCPVQVTIIERYGQPISHGEARSWDERHLQPTRAGMKRGQNVCHAQYRKDGSPKLRQIYIYASTDDSPNYTMVTMEDQNETNAWYNGKLDIEKKFALVHVEWADQGYRWNGGANSGNLNVFTKK
jgi:hypothetical protein